MKTKLSRKDVEAWHTAKDALAVLENKITDRVSEILVKIVKEFGGELDCWYVEGARSCTFGDISWIINKSVLEDELVSLECLIIKANLSSDGYGSESATSIIDGEEIDLLVNFPTRWLFADTDIAEEIATGRASYRERVDAKKRKAKDVRGGRQRALFEAIKAKLSPSEIKFIEKKLK